MKYKKSISLAMVSIITITSAGIMTTGNSHAARNLQSEEMVIKVKDLSNNDFESFTISDYEFMLKLESMGYDIDSLYTKEEIEEAKSTSLMRYGQSKVVKIKDGHYKIYLSSAVAGAAKNIGAGAIAFLFGSAMGPAGAVIAAAIINNGYDTSKGAIFDWKKNSRGDWSLAYLGGQ